MGSVLSTGWHSMPRLYWAGTQHVFYSGRAPEVHLARLYPIEMSSGLPRGKSGRGGHTGGRTQCQQSNGSGAQASRSNHQLNEVFE